MGKVKKVKKEKKERVKKAKKEAFPVPTPLEVAMPAGFSFGTNKPLKKKDFSKKSLYLLHTAALHEFRAEQCRTQAETADRPKVNAKVKRAEKLRSRLTDVLAELKDSGVDISAFLK